MSSQFVFVKKAEGKRECDNCFMPLPIHVDEYSGHRANQRPRSFTVDEQVFNIEAVLDQWYEPSGTYFKVQTTERKVYLLRYDGEGDEWTLQSGFDGDELFARPSIEFITVGPEVIHRAEELTESCEHCCPGDAEIPFDWLLAEVIGKRWPAPFIQFIWIVSPNQRRNYCSFAYSALA
jgi:hypothetical protein